MEKLLLRKVIDKRLYIVKHCKYEFVLTNFVCNVKSKFAHAC